MHVPPARPSSRIDDEEQNQPQPLRARINGRSAAWEDGAGRKTPRFLGVEAGFRIDRRPATGAEKLRLRAKGEENRIFRRGGGGGGREKPGDRIGECQSRQPRTVELSLKRKWRRARDAASDTLGLSPSGKRELFGRTKNSN